MVGAGLIAALTGGRLARLGELGLHARRLALLAVGAQIVGSVAAAAGIGGRAVYLGALSLSAALAAAFLARNLRVPGLPLIAVGLLLNVAVVGANGAMPVSIYAAARAGVPITAISDGSDPRHIIAGEATPLGGLGDIVPVPLPLQPEVASVGDLLIAAGLGLLVFAGMRGGGRRPRRDGFD